MSALEAALAAGRAAAAGLQRETVTLYRPGVPAFDWDTGTDGSATPLALYTGSARVKPVARSRGEEIEAGEANVTLREYAVSLPWATETSERPAVGDLIEVTASPNARMVGLRLWVTGVEFSSTATAWRISAEDRS
ncbi:DUF6093 family protein [Streptomyces nymphaeiformis]|uniref:Uncharacterized protein n=1 Tax=Streptomyces nymphaeiformis TaxID=2663842 RepID=A0A7W7U6E2_9ACTN|nr:DUF6093 family protein [Streptomyces nymphaeiformis]MBB4985032.1 hypothetical protein [Streptomyces nymphaeiformis]